MGLVDDLGHVQQRLGGNAALVETHAAGVLLLADERDLHTEVGRIERGRVAARAGAENGNFQGFGIG